MKINGWILAAFHAPSTFSILVWYHNLILKLLYAKFSFNIDIGDDNEAKKVFVAANFQQYSKRHFAEIGKISKTGTIIQWQTKYTSMSFNTG